MPVLPGYRPGALRLGILVGIIIAGAMMMPVSLADTRVPANDPRVILTGAWQRDGDTFITPYPGSDIRFRLAGRGRLYVDAPGSNMVSLRVLSSNGALVWDGVWNDAHVDLDSPQDGADWRVQFVASAHEGFYTNHPSMLRFHGLALDEGARLDDPPARASRLRLAFLGDSITAGSVIRGREGAWHENSDATLTYAFLTAALLEADHAIRGFPGAQLDELTSVFPWFCEGISMTPSLELDWVVINAGANDRQLNAHQYRNKLKELVDLIRATHPDTRVLLLNFFRMTPSRLPDLEFITRQYPVDEVLCFDARPYLVDYTDRHVHPGPESHQRLGGALAEYIREYDLDSPPDSDAMKHP